MSLILSFNNDHIISKLIFLCGLASFIHGTDQILTSISCLDISDKFAWSYNDIGFVFSCYYIGYFISLAFFSKLSSKYSSKVTITLSITLWIICSFLSSFSLGYTNILGIFRFISGLGSGLFLPAIFHSFSIQLSQDERHSAFIIIQSFSYVGQIFSALICPYFIWNICYMIFSALGIVWLIIWIRFHKKFPDAFLDVNLVTQYHQVTDLGVPIKGVLWTQYLKPSPLWAIYIGHFCINWTLIIFKMWLPIHLYRYFGLRDGTLSIMAIPYLLSFISELASVRLYKFLANYKGWNPIYIQQYVNFISLICIGIFTILLGFATSNKTALIYISLILSFAAINTIGRIYSFLDLSQIHVSVPFIISNTFATIPGIVIGPMAGLLITESQGRWLPLFIITAFVNFVGACAYFVETKTMNNI